MLDDRAKILLKALVERYIADGQPVGSRTLSRASGLDLSAATIRNVMADLEELGLIVSPHTSAGRVPTPRGYRLFVDTMLTARPVNMDDLRAETQGQLQPDQPQRVIASAAHMLSSLSQFVGVVTSPRKASVFHHVEFLRLGDKRVLVILVSPDGDVQNRVIFTATDYTQSQLVEASNILNTHYSGLSIEEMRQRLKGEVDQLRSEIAVLMRTPSARLEPSSRRMSWVFCSNKSNMRRSEPRSLEKSCTVSKLRSPETTSCSVFSAMTSPPACTAALINTAISLRS